MKYNWTIARQDYREYLTLERALSRNSIEAYVRDFSKFALYFDDRSVGPLEVKMTDVEGFMASLFDIAAADTTRSRMLSSLRSFFGYLVHTDRLESSPVDLLSSPIVHRALPETISYEEILRIFETVDLSEPLGHRNRAILEVLYSCGIRVSELTGLRLADLFLDQGVIRVRGKGNKERLTPISDVAVRFVELYLQERHTLQAKPEAAEIVFLNKNGGQLTRVMIFYIVRSAAAAAGITRQIHPHTFRHSFASHLVNGGADILAVQKMLGHESVTTTEIYTHLDTTELRKSVELLEPANKALQDRS